MDRRRFVPSAEGLEGRALLATNLFGLGSTSNRNAPADEVPMTFALKEHRIERLPHYLELIKDGRSIPTATVRQLQADLLTITTELHAPGTGYLDGYNSRLRSVEPKSSLSVADAQGLNHSFNTVVTAAGATPQQVNNLSNDMNALARNDAQGPQPVFLATNDYTLVLETILGVGRPIRRPTVPQLAARNGKRVTIDIGVTPKSQPTIVGTYDAFSLIQVVDAQGNVYGTGTVKKTGATQSNGVAQATGKYAVTFDKPLADGLYTFYVRASDSTGHVSHLSPPFKIKVNTGLIKQTSADAVPGGPLAQASK